MLRIVLIRPGSTEFDRQRRIQGVLDIPLSDAGRAEVSRVIEPLRGQGIGVLYAVASEAAEETARLLAQGLKIKHKTLEKLTNLKYGLWQGMLIDDVRLKQPRIYRQWQEQPETVCPPDGEMLTDLRQRAAQALAKLRKKHKEGVIGLVAPEPLASVIRCLLGEGSLGDLWHPGPGGSWQAIDANGITSEKGS